MEETLKKMVDEMTVDELKKWALLGLMFSSRLLLRVLEGVRHGKV